MEEQQQLYPNLSSGIIKNALPAEDGTNLNNLVLQILTVKVVHSKDPANKDRKNYRGLLSDGVDTVMALFANDCCAFFDDETQDRKFSVCRFNQAQIKVMNGNKKLWIMTGLQCIYQATSKIEVSQQEDTPNLMTKNEPVQSMSSLSAFQPMEQNNSNFGAPVPQNYSGFESSNNNGSLSDFANTSDDVVPISSINPFMNKWKIKGTVSFKSPIKNYKNARGEGKLFNVQFIDQSGEIRATGFNEQLDKFYPLLEVNKTYFISAMKIASANKQFSKLNHDFELTFTINTEVTESHETTQSALSLYNFIKIADIEQHEIGSEVDVLAVVKEVNELHEFVSSKTNKELQKRDLILVDPSMRSVRFTIWGIDAISFNYPVGSVIQGRSLTVNEFQGKNLSMGFGGSLAVNPEAQEGYELKQWWQDIGQHDQFSSLGGGGSSGEPFGNWPLMNLGEALNRPTPDKDMPEKFSCRAMATFVRDNATYPACPGDKCNKKVTESGTEWYCAKCDRTYPEPVYRYILHVCISDAYNNTWVSVFHDQAEILLNGPANEYAKFQDDKYQVDNVIYSATYKPFLFYITAQSDFYNDIARTRYVVRKIIKEDASEAAKIEAEEIKAYFS